VLFIETNLFNDVYSDGYDYCNGDYNDDYGTDDYSDDDYNDDCGNVGVSDIH